MATHDPERTAPGAQRPADSFPFEREVREQHDALRAFVRWLEVELERGGPLDLPALLETFGDELARHFRYEEENGLADAFHSEAPEFQRWSAELVRQHAALEQRLQEIRRRASEVGATRPPWSDVADFCTELRRHDAEENALLSWRGRGGAAAGRAGN